MTIAGHGGTDIVRQFVGNVVNIFKKKRAVCTGPCDGIILKMHYQWTFWLFMAGFSAIWYSWYYRDVITCVSHFNADTQVRLDYITICLSYPYVEIGEEKRFLLFYKWVHWSLLFLAFCLYIPRKMSKILENPRLKKLFEDLSNHLHRYDQAEKDLVDRAARFIVYNLNTHNGIYLKFICCNIAALVVDLFCFNFLNFLLQGRFMHYGWLSFPYNRDPDNFTDYMSTTFPPFAKCTINKENMITAKRAEVFGCHLTVMELYDKIFLFVWLWLIVLIILTSLYLLFLIFLNFPYLRMIVLRVAKSPIAKDSSVTETLRHVLECCKIGDVYILYRLKQHMSHARYFELMTRLTDPEIMKIMVDEPSDRVIMNKNQELPRRRNINMSGPKKMFGNPTDHFNPNTSILVE